MAGDYNATLVGRVEVAPGLEIIRVAPDRRPFEHKAGQYFVLGMKATEPRVREADPEEPLAGAGEPADRSDGQPAVDAQAVDAAAADPERMIKRAFCVTSESRVDEYLEFYVTLVSSGELTPRLFDLKVGGRLFVGPRAEGLFTVDKALDKHVLMIATGTGLAPHMAMIRSELGFEGEGPRSLRAIWQCNGSRQFAIVHGAKYSWDLGYRTELMGLARHCSNFHYLPVITRPQDDETWRGRTGYLQHVIASGAIEKETGFDLTPDNFHVFLSGNPGMIDAVAAWAEGRGFSPDRGSAAGTLHVERFW